MKNKLPETLCLAVIGVFTALQAEGKGTEAYPFLVIPVSARVTGMGENSVATVRGSEAMLHNPAGLAHTRGWQIASDNLFSPQYFRMNNIAVASSIRKNSALGVGVLALTQPSLQKYDNAGNNTGEFNNQDIQTHVSLAHNAGALSLGGTVKLIQSQIADSKSTSFAFDAGMQKQFSRLTLAFALTNFGPDARYSRESAPLPTEAKLGVAVPVSNLLIGGEFTRSVNSRENRFNLGAEYRIAFMEGSRLSLRGGYMPSFANAAGSDLLSRGVRSGFGIQMRSLSLNYAVSPLADLGMNHSFSLSVQFATREVK